MRTVVAGLEDISPGPYPPLPSDSPLHTPMTNFSESELEHAVSPSANCSVGGTFPGVIPPFSRNQ